MQLHFSGSGPGVQARDGCSVDLYNELPDLGELDDVLGLIPAGAGVLELGCGPGRLTRVLIGHGAVVTGVDNSAEMLAGLPAPATPVLADIEALALPERFDVALLASGLIHHPDRRLRRAFLCAAARHLKPGGLLLVQRHATAWQRDVRAGDVSTVAGTRYEIERVEREGHQVAMTVRYDRAMRCWRHAFVFEMLDDGQVEQALQDAGFDALEWQGARRLWIGARPAVASV